MPGLDKLEIVTPDGKIHFFDLDPIKGITTIGQDAEYDIVIGDRGRETFQLVLDHQKKPYRIMILSAGIDGKLGGQRLAPNNFQEFRDWQTLELDGYCFSLLENVELPLAAGVQASPVLTQPALIPLPSEEKIEPPRPAAEGLPAVTLGASDLRVRPPDVKDDLIIASISARNWSIDVEQPAACELLISNGGGKVAVFEVRVEGVDGTWVNINPTSIKLNDGDQAMVNVSIIPPRQATSTAGDHFLVFRITSPQYSGHECQLGATLNIKPYIQFSTGTLDTSHQTISWGKAFATSSFSIQNMGNSPAGFQVTAQDEENGCRFEFPDVKQAKQAIVSVGAGESLPVPVKITPLRRSLVSLKSKQYQYSVTTTALDKPADIHMLYGTLTSRPRFGIFSILVFLVVLLGALAGAIFLVFQPRIDSFRANNSVIRLGEPATLRWKVSPFTSDLRIDGVTDPVTGSQGQISTIPSSNATTYTLFAGNWFSRMLRMEDLHSQPVTVLAISPYPQIVTFFVDRTLVFQSDQITVKWSVSNADEASLTVEGVTQTLKKDQLNGEGQYKLKGDTLVVLEARNNSGTVTRSEFVQARPIRIDVKNFTVSAREIVKGDPVTISWDIGGEGVESVNISPFKDALPMTGALQFFPQASMEFVLTVKARDQQEIRLLSVGVSDKIVPTAPSIDIFKVTPEQMQVGGGSVEFAWSVSGQTTRIAISSKDGVLADNLPAQGFRSFNISKTTSFIMTAYNGSLSTSKEAMVTVAQPKKDVYIAIKSIEPNNIIRKGDAVLVYVNILAANGSVYDIPSKFGWPEIGGIIVATDGYDTCTITLPALSCKLTLNHTETLPNKKNIWATYQGDDNYGLHESAHVEFPFDVVGAPAHFSKIAFTVKDNSGNDVPATSIVAGQAFTVSVEIVPDDPAPQTAVVGKVEVTQGGKAFCTIDLIPVVATFGGKGTCPQHPTLPLQGDTAGKDIFLYFVYQGNDVYASIQASAYINVQKAPTVTNISNITPPITVIGQQNLTVSFEVKVDPNSKGSGVPTGTVNVRDRSNPGDFCSVTMIITNGGSGSCKLVLTQPGDRQIEAVYQESDNFLSSTSTPPTAHHVDASPTSTNISGVTFLPPATFFEVGQSADVTATVQTTGGGTGTPSGSVEIYQDSILPANLKCTGQLVNGQARCTVSLTKHGVLNLYAYYPGGAIFGSSTSTVEPISVLAADTVTQITGHTPDPSIKGDPITVGVNVQTTRGGRQPTRGTVTVSVNTGETCNVDYNSGGSNTCQLTLSNQGIHTLTAQYQGSLDLDYAASLPSSPPINHMVKQQADLTLTTTQSNTIVDTPVTFNLTLTGTGPTGNPTGKITVTASTGEACSPDIDVIAGQTTYSCPITFTTAGTRTVRATYSGDNNYAGTFKEITYNVVKAGVNITVSISTDPNNPKVGETVSISFTVTPVGTSQTPTGNITLTENPSGIPGSTSICVQSLVAGSGSCQYFFTSAGSHDIQAAFAETPGSNRYDPNIVTVSRIIDKGNTNTSIAFLDSNNAVITSALVGQAVTIEATITVVNNTQLLPTSGSVLIPTCGALPINLSGSNKASCTTSFNSVGTQTVTATYQGDGVNFNTSTNTAQLLINPADTTTGVAASPSPSIVGQPVTITATVSSQPPGGGTPQGDVTFTATYTGAQTPKPPDQTCNNVTMNGGQATCPLTFSTAGTWQITADYHPDANHNTSSGSINQTVNKASITLTLSPDPATVTWRADMTQAFTFTLSVNSPGSGTPTGTVSLTATPQGSGNTSSCTNISLASSCSITVNRAGAWNLVASYSGDDNFNSITNTPVTLNVGLNTPTVSIQSMTPTANGNDLVVTVQVTGNTNNNHPPTGNVTIEALTTGITCTHALDNSGIAQCTLNNFFNLPTGTYTIRATYNGDNYFDVGSDQQPRTVP